MKMRIYILTVFVHCANVFLQNKIKTTFFTRYILTSVCCFFTITVCYILLFHYHVVLQGHSLRGFYLKSYIVHLNPGLVEAEVAVHSNETGVKITTAMLEFYKCSAILR